MSGFQVTSRHQGSAGILVIHGDVTADTEQPMNEALAGLLEDGSDHVVLDVTNTQYVNSGGVATLISFLNQMQRKGGRLSMANPNKQLRKIMETVGLAEQIPIFSSVDDALQG